jgi:hypothetical protein
MNFFKCIYNIYNYFMDILEKLQIDFVSVLNKYGGFDD